MSLFPWQRAFQLRTRIKTPFLSASISTRQNALAPTASKRISIAATVCRSPPLSIILSPAARRRQIAECDAAVITSCERHESQPYLWNADSLLTRPKRNTCKTHPTVRNSQQRSPPEFLGVLPSRAP